MNRPAFVQLGDVEVELIQPVEGRNAYQDFLDETGGGIQHILFEVGDIDPVLRHLAKSGVTVLQSGTGIRPGTRWALLDTRELLGFFVELRHRPGESIVWDHDRYSGAGEISSYGTVKWNDFISVPVGAKAECRNHKSAERRIHC